VVYAAPAQGNPKHTAVVQLSLGGTSTLLAEHDWDGHFTASADGDDGSLYYMITGRKGDTYTQLMRAHPGGQVETICEGLPPGCYLVGGKLLVSVQQGGITIQDLHTGATRRGPIPADINIDNVIGMESVLSRVLSPDGRWVITRKPNYTDFHIAATDDGR
jgi:hypothetical protein